MTRLQSIFLVCPLLAMLALAPAQAAELIIVTSKDNLERLDPEAVAKIFLGKVTRFPSGEPVVPLNMDPADPGFAEFARLVLKKSPGQLKAYWAKRIFTGKGKPPRTVANLQELRRLVTSDKRYVGYLLKSDADHSMRWAIVVN